MLGSTCNLNQYVIRPIKSIQTEQQQSVKRDNRMKTNLNLFPQQGDN